MDYLLTTSGLVYCIKLSSQTHISSQWDNIYFSSDWLLFLWLRVPCTTQFKLKSGSRGATIQIALIFLFLLFPHYIAPSSFCGMLGCNYKQKFPDKLFYWLAAVEKRYIYTRSLRALKRQWLATSQQVVSHCSRCSHVIFLPFNPCILSTAGCL